MRSLVAAVILLASGLGAGAEQAGRATTTTTYDPNDSPWSQSSPCLPRSGCSASNHSVARARHDGIVAALVIVTRSASRGGVLGLAAVILALLFLSRDVIPRRWRLPVLTVATLVLATAPAVFWDRLRTFENVSQDYNLTAETGRVAIWKRGVGYFLERPFTEWGWGSTGWQRVSRDNGSCVPAWASNGLRAQHVYPGGPPNSYPGLDRVPCLSWPTVRAVRRAGACRENRGHRPCSARLGPDPRGFDRRLHGHRLFLSAAYGPVT